MTSKKIKCSYIVEKIEESKGTASEKGAVHFDFSKILTYVCDIIGAPKEMYCAINLAVEWRTSI